MNLKVAERLHLLTILPKEGTIVTLRIVADLRKALAFSEDEILALQLVQDELGTRWDAKKDDGKEIEVGPEALKTIKATIAALDKAEKITLEMLPMAERFSNTEVVEAVAEKAAT